MVFHTVLTIYRKKNDPKEIQHFCVEPQQRPSQAPRSCFREDHCFKGKPEKAWIQIPTPFLEQVYTHRQNYLSTTAHICLCLCAQSCLNLCNPVDSSQPGSSVHGIFQARILEWFAISFSRRSSRPGD